MRKAGRTLPPLLPGGRSVCPTDRPVGLETPGPLRSWEVWDNEGVAHQVDAYWLGSPDEMARRMELARLVAGYAKGRIQVLEVGCGTGLIYDALHKVLDRRLRYTGIDNSEAMLAIAHKRFPRGMFLEGDAFMLGYETRKFDVACAFEVFGHMPDCLPALAELVRVGQTAIFTLWTDDGEGVRPGGEHYLYGLEWVRRTLGRVAREGYRLATVPVGPTTAFVVEEGAP